MNIAFCDKCHQECYWDEYTAKDGRTFSSLKNVDGEEWHFKTCVFNELRSRGQASNPAMKSKQAQKSLADIVDAIDRRLSALEAKFNAKFPS